MIQSLEAGGRKSEKIGIRPGNQLNCISPGNKAFKESEVNENIEVNGMLSKIIWCGCISIVAAMLAISCAQSPTVQPKPEPEIKPTPPPFTSGFVMKSFHRSMSEEMRKSYDRADEIIIGIFTGIYHDKKDGLICYFSDFNRFDKETLSWGSPQNVIMKIRPDEFKPKIIRRNEFKRLIDLDRIGICWDYYQGNRYIYLVEGKKNLLFLELGYDDASNASYRNLLDAYPVTDECRARDVFNLMIRDLVSVSNHRSCLICPGYDPSQDQPG